MAWTDKGFIDAAAGVPAADAPDATALIAAQLVLPACHRATAGD
jgi:hypothetical protein